MLSAYRATQLETGRPMPGDELVTNADLAVNSAFTIQASPEEIWPWLVQAGKGRAGWYLPYGVERLTPDTWHGARHIVPELQDYNVGDTMGDWSGKDAEFEVVEIDPPHLLVYRGLVRKIDLSWALTISRTYGNGTRVHSRTRLSPIKHKRVAGLIGGFADRLVAAALARGLEDRLGLKHNA